MSVHETHGVIADMTRPLSSPSTDAPAAAGTAVRRLGEALLWANADGVDDEALLTVAADVDAIVARLGVDPVARAPGPWAHGSRGMAEPVTSPVNAIAPPLPLVGDDDGVHGRTVLSILHQGRAGYAHGGVTAMLLDHTLGVAAWWGGSTGMTRSIEVEYLRPVPLGVEIEVWGRLASSEGRVGTAEGGIRQAGVDLVRASGAFIEPRAGRPGAFDAEG